MAVTLQHLLSLSSPVQSGFLPAGGSGDCPVLRVFSPLANAGSADQFLMAVTWPVVHRLPDRLLTAWPSGTQLSAVSCVLSAEASAAATIG